MNIVFGAISLLIVCFAPRFSVAQVIHAQSPDVRTKAEYRAEDGSLQCKYEYYYDFWAERNVMHGRYSEWNAANRIVLDGFYKNGLQDSIWKHNYGSGVAKEVAWWANGQRSGTTALYDRDGRTISEIHYRADLMDGVGYFYYTNGQIKEISQYKQGVLHGTVNRFKKNGKKKSPRSYLNGKRVKVKQAGKKETQKSSEVKKKQEKEIPKPKSDKKAGSKKPQLSDAKSSPPDKPRKQKNKKKKERKSAKRRGKSPELKSAKTPKKES